MTAKCVWMCTWGRGQRSNGSGCCVPMRVLFMFISRRFLAHHPRVLIILPRSDSTLSSWSWEWQLSRADYRPSTRPLVGYHVKFDEKMRPQIRLVTSLKNQEKQSSRESLSLSFYLSSHHCHSLKRKFTQAFCYRMPVCWWHNRSRANIRITRSFFFPNAGLTTWVSFLVIIYLL